MRQLHKLWRTALLACITGALLLGASAVYAQEAESGGDVAEANATDGLWVKLDAVRAALHPDAIQDADGAAEIGSAAAGLLIGSADEVGVITLVQQLAGVNVDEIGDAHAVVLAGDDRPEILALAHLLLAAEALTNSPDQTDLLLAGQHVEQANTLLAHLRPVE